MSETILNEVLLEYFIPDLANLVKEYLWDNIKKYKCMFDKLPNHTLEDMKQTLGTHFDNLSEKSVKNVMICFIHYNNIHNRDKMFKMSTKSVLKDGMWSSDFMNSKDNDMNTFHLYIPYYRDLFLHNIRVNVKCDLYCNDKKLIAIHPNQPFSIPTYNVASYYIFSLVFSNSDTNVIIEYDMIGNFDCVIGNCDSFYDNDLGILYPCYAGFIWPL